MYTFLRSVPALTALLLWVLTLNLSAMPGSTPPNTLCAGATVVPVSIGTPATVTGNNTGSLTDPVLGATLVWEGFTTTACSDLTVSYCGTLPLFEGGLAYLAVGCPLTNLVFNSGQNVIPNVCGDGNFAILFPELPPGTYYYPVLEAPGSSGDYRITFSAVACTSTPPANAFCNAPIELTPGASCTATTGTVQHAVVAGNSGVGCAGGDVSDGVWFSFVATSTAHDITVVGSSEFAAAVELFSGTCAGLTAITCGSAADFGLTETISSSVLSVGQTYLVRVSDWYAGVPRTSTFDICVVEVATATCDADAGTLTADASSVCVDGTVTISATTNNDAVIPAGYERVYVLTSGEDIVIQQADVVPSFQITEPEVYTIHTLVYDPATLDLGSIVFGESLAADINGLLIQGGGDICGSLDLAGAPIAVTLCCDASAGALDPVSSFECLVNGSSPVGAIVETPSVVPSGYVLAYVLSQGPDRIIQQLGTGLTFTVEELGAYTIHAFVYEPTTIDPAQVIIFGTTTATELHALFAAGGGNICGSFDVNGTIITVLDCCLADAGTLTADDDELCYPHAPVTISATPNGDITVPEGSNTVYALSLDGIIQATAGTPSFTASGPGVYTIHTLVYDPATLGLDTIVIGESTTSYVNSLFTDGGGAACGSLDLAGAVINVRDCRPLNDDCSAASLISVSLLADCGSNSVNGNNAFATGELGSSPSCDETTAYYADVWYRFNSGDNEVVSIVFNPGTMTDWGITVSDGCAEGVEVACEVMPAVPVDVTTTPNTDYWLRVYSDIGSGSGGNFSLCVSGATPTIVCNGATVTLGDGSSNVTICQDGNPDVIDVVNTSASVEQYAYVVTDEDDSIVALMAMGSLDFNALPMGTYRIWGISYNGTLEGADPASPLSGITSAGSCLDQSDNFALVTVEICSAVAERGVAAWSMFPNPSSGVVNIRYAGESGLAAIEVIDMGGRIISNERVVLQSGQVYVLGGAALLAPGMYTVRLSANGEAQALRLVVQ